MIILTLWINLLFFFPHLIDELFGLNKSENNENEWWYEYFTSKKKKKLKIIYWLSEFQWQLIK